MNSRIAVTLVAVSVAAARPALAEDTLMPRIVHEACSQFARGKPYEIVARFEDESNLFDPKVMYRTRADSRWKTAPFSKREGSESFTATIKARELRGTLEYFIEVWDENGNGPARVGSPEAPIRLQGVRRPEPCVQIPQAETPVTTTAASATTVVATPADAGAAPTAGLTPTGGATPPPPPGTCDRPDRPLYCEGWLWGTVGAVALAGAGAGAYFIFFAGKDDEKPQHPDSVSLIVDGPDPTTVPLRFQW